MEAPQLVLRTRMRRRAVAAHAVGVSAVWLVTGAQASGKSTVADLLARRFERGVHVRGGEFYRWAVRGWVHVGDPDEREARRLLDLRYELASTVADTYAAAGFTVVAQDNIYGVDVEQWLDRTRATPKHLVVLRPTVAVVEARDEERQTEAREDCLPRRLDSGYQRHACCIDQPRSRTLA